MTFFQAIRSGFANYVRFSGRAGVAEFWYWLLFTIICSIVVGILDGLLFAPADDLFAPLTDIFAVLIVLPDISVAVRRLHDTDRSGWWLLLILVPVAGLILVAWWIEQGSPGANRFGADPVHAAELTG